MEMTMSLAQIWGPLLFAFGLGVVMSRAHYTRIYREIEKEPFAVMLFGMTALALGTIQVMSHNVWDTLPQILISLLGWGLLLKGAAAVIKPRWMDQGGNRIARNQQMMSAIGIAMLVIGGYLSWLAYFA